MPAPAVSASSGSLMHSSVRTGSYARTTLGRAMTATRLPTGFASLDRPAAWPAPRSRPRPAELAQPLDTLPGVGPTIRKRLSKLGLETVGDLLLSAPFRYEPAAPERRITDLRAEEEVAIAGEVRRVSSRRGRGRLTILTAIVSDGSDSVPCVWVNQQWLQDKLQPGTRVRLRGALRRGGFNVKAYDLGGDGASTADFAPVYHASEQITPKKLRELVGAALEHARDLPDPLPATLKERKRLPLRADALHALHRPSSLEQAEEGRRRLAFDELLLLQMVLARRTREREASIAPSLGEPGELVLRYRKALPFALTPHQEQAIRELDGDLARTVPMQRLLQGDVGSGKTVVALYALLRAVENRRQGALMAPTETLAEQHFLTIEGLCAELGVVCALLTSASRKREREAALGADVVVGTHALIQEGVELRDLAVAVVDEQHRFGVEQRKALAQGRAPHVLHMTATPIPRTLALTVYGDLAVSEIAKPPASRKPIVTSRIQEERASVAYTRLTRLLREGRQAYVVCPLVEASETTLARAAEDEAERLRGARCLDRRLRACGDRPRAARRRPVPRHAPARSDRPPLRAHPPRPAAARTGTHRLARARRPSGRARRRGGRALRRHGPRRPRL